MHQYIFVVFTLIKKTKTKKKQFLKMACWRSDAIKSKLFSPINVDNTDTLIPAFNTTRFLFKEFEQNKEFFIQFFSKLYQKDDKLYIKFFDPKRILNFFNDECTSSEINLCQKVAIQCQHVNNKQNKDDDNSKNNKNKIIKDFHILSLPDDILAYSWTYHRLHIKSIPFTSLELVCTKFCKSIREYLYYNHHVFLSDQRGAKAVLSQWKYKRLKHITLRGVSHIWKFRDSWRSLVTLDLDFAQIIGIDSQISVRNLIIQSRSNSISLINKNSLAEIKFNHFFKTESIQTLEINGLWFTDSYINYILNCNYNKLKSLCIIDWIPQNCEFSSIQFDTSKLYAPSLNIIKIKHDFKSLTNILETTNGEVWLNEVHSICKAAFNNNNINNDNKLCIYSRSDAWCKSIENHNILNNHKYFMIKCKSLNVVSISPKINSQKYLYDSDPSTFTMTDLSKVLWEIDIDNVNNVLSNNSWEISIGIEGSTQQLQFSVAPKIKFKGPNKATFIKGHGDCNIDQYKYIQLKNGTNHIKMKLENNKLSFIINNKDCGDAIYYNDKNIGNLNDKILRCVIRSKITYIDDNLPKPLFTINRIIS